MLNFLYIFYNVKNFSFYILVIEISHFYLEYLEKSGNFKIHFLWQPFCTFLLFLDGYNKI